MAGTCECGKESSGSMKCGEFLDWLKTGQVSKLMEMSAGRSSYCRQTLNTSTICSALIMCSTPSRSLHGTQWTAVQSASLAPTVTVGARHQIADPSVWDLWRTNWQRDRFLSQKCFILPVITFASPPLSLVSHQTCVTTAVDSIVKPHTFYSCLSKRFFITKYKQMGFDCTAVSRAPQRFCVVCMNH